VPTIDLVEWQHATPESHPSLFGLSLDPSGDPSSDRGGYSGGHLSGLLARRERALLLRLDEQRMVSVRELRSGMSVATTSYVGSIAADPLTIRIQPKLGGRALAGLLAYAVGMDRIHLLPEHEIGLATQAFQDLLVLQLAAEASRILASGIHRSYLTTQMPLSQPRGRILFAQLARAPMTTAVLPCRVVEREENVLANRVLLAGLQRGGRLAISPLVRTRVQRVAHVLADRVEPALLVAETFRRLARESSRLTTAYEPAFALIRMLVAGSGVGPETDTERTELPGFLFDMNRFFQEAVERFLREWLEDAKVLPQERLRDIFRYDPFMNPRRRRAPAPRPDFVMSREGKIVAIADAKYRDLWEHTLPADMLYQLSVYALGQADCHSVIILYATMASDAREARIAIADPIRGHTRAHVILRPVCLPELADLVCQPRSLTQDRRRHRYAAHLAFGAPN
jgi:5-methylcytosine-specific restriction enzyme subunit McrC